MNTKLLKKIRKRYIICPEDLGDAPSAYIYYSVTDRIEKKIIRVCWNVDRHSVMMWMIMDIILPPRIFKIWQKRRKRLDEIAEFRRIALMEKDIYT